MLLKQVSIVIQVHRYKPLLSSQHENGKREAEVLFLKVRKYMALTIYLLLKPLRGETVERDKKRFITLLARKGCSFVDQCSRFRQGDSITVSQENTLNPVALIDNAVDTFRVLNHPRSLDKTESGMQT